MGRGELGGRGGVDRGEEATESESDGENERGGEEEWGAWRVKSY